MEKIEVFEEKDETGGLIGVLLICGGVCITGCAMSSGVATSVCLAPSAEVGVPVPV